MSEECATSARSLRSTSLRGSMNRLYYSTYCLAVEKVERFGPFQGHQKWQNPPHDQIPGLLVRLPGVSNDVKRKLVRNFKELYKKRVDADYRPSRQMDEAILKEMFRKAEEFASLLGAQI